MKRKITLLLSAVIVSMSISTTSFASINFKDMNDAPWEGAKTFIQKAGDLNIMVGDNGYFRPKSNVTCFETTQLVYSLLKSTNIVKSNTGLMEKWTPLMANLKVPTWAYESMSYALEYDIVKTEELKNFANQNTGVANYAAREAAAVIMGRALNDKFPLSSSTTVSFADKSSINEASLPYVELLSRLNIFMGDENNNFKPKTAINRAEMAVIVTKAYDIVAGNNSNGNSNTSNGNVVQLPTNTEKIVTGTVQSVIVQNNAVLVVVKQYDNTTNGFSANQATSVTRLSGGTATYMNILVGDIVTVTYNNDGTTAKNVIIQQSTQNTNNTNNNTNNTTQTTKTVTGYLDEMNANMLYLETTKGKIETYYYSDSYTITLNESKSSQKDIVKELKDEDVEVTLTLDAQGKITDVKATTKKSDYIYGTLKSISYSEISIRKNNSSSTTDYDLVDDDLEIYLENKKSSISEIKNKSYTLYVKMRTNSKGDAREIYFSEKKFSSTDDEITGKAEKVNDDYVTVDGDKYYWAKKPSRIRLEGKSADIDDIIDAFKDYKTLYVRLVLDKDGDIDELYASDTKSVVNTSSSSSSSDEISGEYYSMKASSITIKRTNSSKNNTYYFKNEDSDNVKFVLDGSNTTYTKFKNSGDSEYLYVTLYLNSNDEVTRVEGEYDDNNDEIEGDLYEITRTNITIKKSSNSKSTSYDYDDKDSENVKFVLDKKNVEWRDIRDALEKDDIYVTLTLNKYDEVTRIDAKTDGSSSNSGDYSGKIKSLTKTKIEVGNKDPFTVTGSTETKLNDEEIGITKLVSVFDDKDVELTADITVKKGDVTKIEAFTTYAKGELSYFDKDDDKLTIRTDAGNRLDFSFRSSVKIYIDDTQETMSELSKAYRDRTIQVELTCDDGLVTKIEAKIL